MDYAQFDRRGYPTLGVRDGYGEWAESYESVVQDEMDLRLLARLDGIDWPRAGRVLALACGTGRVGAWLRGRGVAQLDGETARLASPGGRRVRLPPPPRSFCLDTLPERARWPRRCHASAGAVTARPSEHPNRRLLDPPL